MISIQNKIRLCIVGNAFTVIMVILPVCLLSENSKYFRFGPSPDFILISVPIDTWTKYIITMIFIAIVDIIRVISEEIGMPIINFNIYNPDKKTITEFTKFELQIYGNSMYALSSMRGVFITLISITQFDIALWSLFIGEIAALFTIRALLNEKKFEEYSQLETIEII
jgi:hypothetical protein